MSDMLMCVTLKSLVSQGLGGPEGNPGPKGVNVRTAVVSCVTFTLTLSQGEPQDQIIEREREIEESREDQFVGQNPQLYLPFLLKMTIRTTVTYQ